MHIIVILMKAGNCTNMYKIEDGWSEFERPLIIAQRARGSYSMTDKGNLELNNFFCTQNKKIL